MTTRRRRCLCAAVAVTAALALVLAPRFAGAAPNWLPNCPIHACTGLFCAGCGATRALALLCQGRLLNALRMNALAVLLLAPATLYALATALARFGFDRRLPRPKPSLIAVTGLLVLALAFTAARNIPIEPFTFLAPPRPGP